MMDFDRREDAATPLDWASSADDLEELKMDIFPDQTPDEVVGKTAQEVVPESDAEESRSHKRKRTGRPRTSAHRRKKKPPGLPKRPLSAYNIFFQEERLKIQEEEGKAKLGFNDFGKIIGCRWKELSDEERQKYNARAKEDTVRYQNEMDSIKDANKRKKEEPEKEQESRNEKLIPTPPWVNLSLGVANSQLPKDSVSTEMRVPLSFSQGLHHQGHPDPHRIHRNHLPAESHYEIHQGIPIPPGMEIILPDASGRQRKYTVRYTAYSMRRGDVENFMKSFSDGERLPERQYQTAYPGEPMAHTPAQAHPQYPAKQKYERQRQVKYIFTLCFSRGTYSFYFSKVLVMHSFMYLFHILIGSIIHSNRCRNNQLVHN